MGLLDDLKGLSSSISSFSGSLHNLISIKQQITQQQATIELEKKMNEIIQRQFRDIDDPAKITQDTYKQALAEYDNLKQRILETYSAPFEKPVAQDVINQYDKSFVNNFAAAYYEKYAEGLRNDYLTLINAKLNLIKDDISFADFINTVNDEKFYSVLAPEDIAKIKQLSRYAKGNFMFTKALQSGMKGEDAAAYISSGGEIGGYKLETPEEQNDFISSVWPSIKQKTLDGFKQTYDEMQKRFDNKKISWNDFSAYMGKMIAEQDSLGIITNEFDYNLRRANFATYMADIGVTEFWGNEVLEIIGTNPDFAVSTDNINKAIELLKEKREEYFNSGYMGAVDKIDEYIKYVRSLGSEDSSGGLQEAKKLFDLSFFEYQVRNENYFAIGSIEAIAMDENNSIEVRRKAIDSLMRLRGDARLNPEKVATYKNIWSAVLQDPALANKFREIQEDANKGNKRAQEFISLLYNNTENMLFGKAKEVYPILTTEEGEQKTSAIILGSVNYIKNQLSAYEKKQTGATPQVSMFKDTSSAIKAMVAVVGNKGAQFVDINKAGFEGVTNAIQGAISNIGPGRFIAYRDVTGKEKQERLLYLADNGSLYDIKPKGAGVSAEIITNPKDNIINVVNNLAGDKVVDIPILPKSTYNYPKIKQGERVKTFYDDKTLVVDNTVKVYTTNYDNILIFDNVKEEKTGKIFRVYARYEENKDKQNNRITTRFYVVKKEPIRGM